MKAVVLVGYMCVGKTTLGHILAKQLGYTFYDLDWYIEERFHTTISQIFAEKGEEGFRELEYRMLHEVAEFENIVLACGGGTPIYKDNMQYLNKVSHTFYLEASVDTILKHIAMSRTKRPLLEGKDKEELMSFITQQLKERKPFYEQAQYKVSVEIMDTTEKIAEITENIIKTLKFQGKNG